MVNKIKKNVTFPLVFIALVDIAGLAFLINASKVLL